MSSPTAVVERCQPRGKLLLLGSSSALEKALPDDIGMALQPNRAVRIPGLGVCLCLSPTQRLLLLAIESGAPFAAARIRAVSAPDAWVLDAGARYVEFAVAGRDGALALNAGCSLDLRETAFPTDSCAQTRFAQVPVLLFRPSVQRFEIFVERPLAHHLWLSLCRAFNDVSW